MTWWQWSGVAGLGVMHGLNPAMGWLFAVAVGLQERSRRALLAALVPIGIGHMAAVGLAVGLVEWLRVLASDTAIRIGGAVVLAGFAAWRLWRGHRHRRVVGMRLRPRELALWSFLMSSAHGAGVMLFPFLLGVRISSSHALVDAAAGAVLLHGLAMVAVAGTVALLVYEFFGLGFLRRGWVNLDRLWPYALGSAAAATLLA